MASWLLQLLPILCLHWLFVTATSTSSSQIPKHYIVYMGSSSNTENGDAEELAHLQLLSSIIPSEESDRISLIYHYKHSFKGFSAMLTDKEASLLSGHDRIVSVFPDTILELETTRSWDFLKEEAEAEAFLPAAKSTWDTNDNKLYENSTYDVIIGVIDSGIWPESESFKDEGMGEIPSRWKGFCMEADDFNKSNCNRKLIGARCYTSENPCSPRDISGHGTHCASIAAGAHVANASYFGLARGTARGGSPSARIASYRVCSKTGCSSASILQAIDDAIGDGVDIISTSIGKRSLPDSDYLRDAQAIGAFHAVEQGVTYVSSAGNLGPIPSTVLKTAPWIFTVAASTIDRQFRSTIILGNGETTEGSAINLSNLSHSPIYPLAFGKDIANNSANESDARGCVRGSLDPKKVEGKIIVCVNDVSQATIVSVAKNALAAGLIYVSEYKRSVPHITRLFPFAQVNYSQGSQIINYIQSTENSTATILPTVEVSRYKPAPVVAYFSSRGPGTLTENILKPDIVAPGVTILAAIVPETDDVPEQANYGFKSGTSMACPHGSGAAAFIKSKHPTWTPSMIRSALMTTANVHDNNEKPITNTSGDYASPHDIGAGEINPLKALYPGLVFNTTTEDYLHFLCYYGYSSNEIKIISGKNYDCPENSTEELISNVNYPSISISKLDLHEERTVIRTVTNVGSTNATYTASVQAPSGLVVKVNPEKIAFTENETTTAFQVSFYSEEAANGYKFGSITWSDGENTSVRVVIAVK